MVNQTDNRLHKEKAKAFKKKHENLSMFGGILLLAVIIGSFCIKSGSTLNITELKGPGYLISHEKTLLVQTGQFNFRLQTNVNLTEDLKRIRHTMEIMTIFCMYLGREYPRHECSYFESNIERQGTQLINQLKFRKNYRNKRSEGFLMWMVHLIIGSNSKEIDSDAAVTTARRTTALVQHSLENFKHVEQQLVLREEALRLNQKKVSDRLDKITKSDSSALRLLELTHYTQCHEIISIIGKRYDDILNGPAWTVKEAEWFNNISKQIPTGHQLPPIALKGLIDLSFKTLYETTNGLAIDYVFPIVSNDRYDELQMHAIPDIQNKRIAIPEGSIAINHVKDLFFQSVEIEHRIAMNISRDIVGVSQTFSIKHSSNCLAQHAADTINRKECPTRMLPLEYDEWRQLAGHNQYLYYTTHVAAYLQCIGKERFTVAMGIVNIPPGCSIYSRSGMIYGSTDKTAAINRP